MELLALDLISGVFILFSAMFNMYATLLMTSKCLFRKRVAFASKGVLIDAKSMTALSCIFFSWGAGNQLVMVLCGLFCRLVGVLPSFTSLAWRNSHIMIKQGRVLFHWQLLFLLVSVTHKQTQLATGPAGYST